MMVLDKREVEVISRYRHEPISDSQTMCGLEMNEIPLEIDVPLSCPCGRPDCEYPVTCPVCLAILRGRAS